MGENKLLISIVDDDAGVRKALLRLLSSLDMNAATFDSGQAFLDSLAGGSPDCLILDLHMPGISGVELLRQLSRIGLRVPTIIITAYDEPEMQCLAAGAQAYLRKPIDEQVLLSAIKSATDNKARAGKIGNESIRDGAR
jgi:FixJ family two-component response regulator